MKKKLKHLLWIKLAFVSLLFCSISLLTAETFTVSVDIIKAKNDSRNYRYIELENGITAVLIFFSFFSNSNILFFFLKIMRSQSTIIFINNIPLV